MTPLTYPFSSVTVRNSIIVSIIPLRSQPNKHARAESTFTKNDKVREEASSSLKYKRSISANHDYSSGLEEHDKKLGLTEV